MRKLNKCKKCRGPLTVREIKSGWSLCSTCLGDTALEALSGATLMHNLGIQYCPLCKQFEGKCKGIEKDKWAKPCPDFDTEVVEIRKEDLDQ